MKSVFISYNKAVSESVREIIDRQRIRGFTQWETVMGRGSFKGEPHMGSHTWPSTNAVIITIVEDEKVAPLLEALRSLDNAAPMQGIRAYVWNIEDQL